MWKKIPNYSRYDASNLGEIRTHDWKGSGVTKIMSPSKDAGGYLRTMLKRDDGVIHTIKVHRIIASTFIKNPNNKSSVNHKNGVKSDNRVENLEWCTHAENIKHAKEHGLRWKPKGEMNPSAKVTEDIVIKIRKEWELKPKHPSGRPKKVGITRAELAKKYNVSEHIIKRIVTRKTWKHL